MKDVSAFAKVLDWILIMNYDTWGCEFYLAFSLFLVAIFGFLRFRIYFPKPLPFPTSSVERDRNLFVPDVD